MSIVREPHRRSTTYDNHRAWELVGARVAAQIEASGMTTTAVAERAGLSQGIVANVKSGSQVPLMAVVRIARALGLKIDDLIPDGAR